MSTTSDFADFVTEQMAGAGNITKRKMMGEYVVYCQEKVIALICDNRLFIKPTSAGRVIMQKSLENKPDPMLEKTSLEITTGNIFEVPPFTGSKCWFMVEDKLEDRDFLAQLIKASYPELPMPKPKKKKAKATPKQRQSNAKAKCSFIPPYIHFRKLYLTIASISRKRTPNAKVLILSIMVIISRMYIRLMTTICLILCALSICRKKLNLSFLHS